MHCNMNVLTILGKEDQLWDLTPLYSSSVGTVWGTLELEGHLSTLHFRHPLLSKVAKFIPIQYGTDCVEGVLLHLHRVFKRYREGVAGSIWNKFC